MKINLNSQDKSRFAEILRVKEHNICAAEIYIEYLNNHYNDITFAKDEKDYYKRFLSCLEINEEDKEFKAINSTTQIDKITKLDPHVFESDSYYKLIKNLKGKDGDIQFLTLKYNAFEGFVFDELEINPKNYEEHTPLGYFEKDFVYPAIIKDERIWMSIIPHEINTMIEPIKNAQGNVLVLGLGLGYYLFHILEKKDVKSVDVIEFDRNVISLFNKHLINLFPNKEKINIIFDDAIKYLANNKKKYDYVFSDIWHNVADGEGLYLKIKAYEDKYPNTKFDYWIETSILSMLRRQTITVIEEVLNGSTEKDYQKAKNENDKIINKIYFYLKDKQLNCFEDILKLLSEQSLKEMAKHLY